MATLFAVAVTIVIAGWLWFFVVRPILEDYGIIRVDPESESVNRSQIVMSPVREHDSADDRTDGTDGRSVSAIDPWLARLEVDRTKAVVIEVLVYSGWTVDEVRAVVKGANDAIGDEVKAARQRLGIGSPDRQLRVRDQTGERLIPMEPRP